MAASEIVVPGQRICKQEEHVMNGIGTYSKNGYIYSSLVGVVKKRQSDKEKVAVDVTTEEDHSVVPSVGSVVTARISNVNPRFCKCAILGVEGTQLTETFRGMIRREDIRATEKDRVEMYKCFRPGDIVLARVLSLGDAMSYLLTTAENELGVVIATSEAGAKMVPISWCEMQCPRTEIKEYRKVAKVQPRHIEYKVEFSKKT